MSAEPTFAAAAEEDPTAEPAFEEDEGSEIICRTEEVIGTKIKRRVCATAAAWAAAQRRTSNTAEESFRQIRERSTIAPPSAAPPTALGGN